MTRLRLIGTLCVALALAGCGTDNPFSRGPDFDDGSSLPPGSLDDLSFATHIKPILNACAGCHSGGAGGWTYDGGNNAHAQALDVVDTGNPPASALLVKGSGGDGHGGGTLFSTNSADYRALLAWIEAGAPNN